MKRQRILYLVLIFLISMMCISAVSADDDSTSDAISANDNGDFILDEAIADSLGDDGGDELILEETDALVDSASENPTLKDGESSAGSFADLNETIYGNEDNKIILASDYTFNGDSEDDSPFINGIVINRSLTIDGKGHTISGNNLSRAFKIEADNVVLIDINFVNANQQNGGAIYWAGANGTVKDCIFMNCIAYDNVTGPSFAYGGAIFWAGANGTILDSSFINCSADSFAIMINTSTKSYSFGGAVFWCGENGSIMNSNFENCSTFSQFTNTSSSWTGIGYCSGGAVYWSDYEGYVDACNFTNNTARNGGAIYFTHSSIVNNSKFEENTVEKINGKDSNNKMPAYGGAIYFASDAEVNNSTFYKNQAKGDFYGQDYDGAWYFRGGGAIYIGGLGLVTNSKFNQNEATDGSAIYSNFKGLEIKDSEFIANKANFGGHLSWALPNMYMVNIQFDCRDNFINAIHKQDYNITLSNVTYWNGELVNSDDGYPIMNYLGTPFNISLIDSEGNVLFNDLVMLNGTNNISFNAPSESYHGGPITFKIDHIEDDYYYDFFISLTLPVDWERTPSSVIINTLESEFNLNECYINYTIQNMTTTHRVVITKEDGEIVFDEEITHNELDDPLISPGPRRYDGLLFVDLPAYDGYYNMTVYNLPTWYVAPSSDSKLFKILPVNSTINVTSLSEIVYHEPINIEIDGENLTTINVTVYDSNKNIVFSQNTTESIFTLPVLPVGEYNVTVFNYGNENITGCENSTVFNILVANNHAIVSVGDVTYGVDTVVFITADGDGEYTVDLNGRTLAVNVVDGVGNASILLDVGVYWANVSFDNPNYDSTFTNDTFEVLIATTEITAKTVTTTYNVNKNLVITIKDGRGKAVKGIQVTVNLGGKKKYTTDRNGQIKIAVGKLVPKTYTAKISFAGTVNYKPSSASAKVTVKKATPKLTAKAKSFKVKAKTKKYTIKLKNNKGSVMKNTKVTLKVNGKTYAAKTNKKGVATFKLSKLTKKGKYTAVITYAGDKYYKKVTKKAKITLKV